MEKFIRRNAFHLLRPTLAVTINENPDSKVIGDTFSHGGCVSLRASKDIIIAIIRHPIISEVIFMSRYC